MIQVQFKKEQGQYKSFQIEGHAEYAEEGEDIICAAVSALVINTAISIPLSSLQRIHLPVTARMV